ncbi:MAG TPA: methionine aminotransferase [Steroidobacteraceae bacterium]|nr:methionine aminotransferase [Steroidobacteraceae bacterium]
MVDVVSKLPHVGTTIFTVMSQRAHETGAINLSQGFPNYDPPMRLKELLAHHANAGQNQYAPMMGVEGLRQQIATKLQRSHGRAFDAQHEVTITLGATEAIFSAIQALVHPGDEVIIFDPSYDSYAPSVLLAGGKPVHIPLEPPSFTIDWQRVRESINARTRLILINSPNNPATTVLSTDDIRELANCVRNSSILIISDEVYEHIVFDGRRHVSLCGHAELAERSVSVFSFGKTMHATGWRIGYAVAPANLTREIRRVHQFNTFTIATPLQYAIADFLREAPSHNEELAGFYTQKRALFLDRLKGSRFRWVPTAGTFFQLLDYSGISSQSDMEFADTLIRDAGVASIPLSPFYAKPPAAKLCYLRFCFAKTDDTLAQAAERLCNL